MLVITLMLFLILKDEECAKCDEAWLGPCPQSQGLRLRWAWDCDQCLRQRHHRQLNAYFFIIFHDFYVIDSHCWISPHHYYSLGIISQALDGSTAISDAALYRLIINHLFHF